MAIIGIHIFVQEVPVRIFKFLPQHLDGLARDEGATQKWLHDSGKPRSGPSRAKHIVPCPARQSLPRLPLLSEPRSGIDPPSDLDPII